MQESAPADPATDPATDPAVAALAAVLGNLTPEQKAALVAALTGKALTQEGVDP